MKLCESCANCCGTNGSEYEPPYCFCHYDREEFDMEDEEVVQMMIENGADPDDCEPDCEQYIDLEHYLEPDPDRAYDEWRDGMLDMAWDAEN